ncbi:chemoreceptor glutamine deamidase CheD [Lichenicoccus roseus]|uniref:Probable chemoreceptor glutamine deamidase CheD n=1 Tax=Lichenicoccus roseus TaxID=2683649 RepID=A0A5R9J4G8_9PROT|nr:chemoreceptor glutamine deamidase CheD [Lichenicoccus roseus]TLU72452.1 chemoreceptor glutamine deamidase CheD [Lichenicoccus roseus]
MKKIKIGPGEHFVTRDPSHLIITVLGSCIAACIRDPVAGAGGMNHFMLPQSDTGNWGDASESMRYGNFAMERLINDILQLGGVRRRLEVKLFGGGLMMADHAAIGCKNADFAEAYLRAENMSVAACDLRGLHARRVEYLPLTGKVMMLQIESANSKVARLEQGFARSIRKTPTGSIELFD